MQMFRNIEFCSVFLPPEIAKVMFLHLSVILFTGGVSASVDAGIHTHPPAPGADSPREQTPPPHGADTQPPCAVHAGRYSQQAGGTHTGMHTCFFFHLNPLVK